MDFAAELDDPTLSIRKINELEKQRKQISEELAQLESECSVKAALGGITEKQVEEILSGFAENFASLPKDKWKDIIKSLADQIVLDPISMEFRIFYRIPVENRICMASPRGVEPLLPG